MGPYSNMACLLIKGGNLETDKHRENSPVNMKAESSQQTSKIAPKPPEARTEAWDRVSLTALRRNLTWSDVIKMVE